MNNSRRINNDEMDRHRSLDRFGIANPILDISTVTGTPDMTCRPIELGPGAANDGYKLVTVLWKRVTQ